MFLLVGPIVKYRFVKIVLPWKIQDEEIKKWTLFGKAVQTHEITVVVFFELIWKYVAVHVYTKFLHTKSQVQISVITLPIPYKFSRIGNFPYSFILFILFVVI
jgi:hypothetical protein